MPGQMSALNTTVLPIPNCVLSCALIAKGAAHAAIAKQVDQVDNIQEYTVSGVVSLCLDLGSNDPGLHHVGDLCCQPRCKPKTEGMCYPKVRAASTENQEGAVASTLLVSVLRHMAHANQRTLTCSSPTMA
jgi:hypothetical protein